MAGLYPELSRVWGIYTSDDTNDYNVGMASKNATDGGFGTAVAGANPQYPKGFVMRHVYGVSSTGTRNSLPCATPDNTLFVSGGTFTKNSVTFTVEGRIGEKRTYKGG